MNIYVPKPEEIPSGLCECGCGKPTNIVRNTVRKKRMFAGHPSPRLRGHNDFKRGAEHHLWKGGRVKTAAGYVLAYARDHPDADAKGYVWEHRLVMEWHLGRRLRPDEFVHHINEVKDDNRIENLRLLSKKEHQDIHAPKRFYSEDARRRMREGGAKGLATRWGPLNATVIS